MTGQEGQCSVERNLSRVWVFISEEPKQSLGSANKWTHRSKLFTDTLALDLLALVIRWSLSCPGAGRAPFTGEIYFLHSKRRGGGGMMGCQGVLLALAACQVTVVQNNPYAIVESLGVACLGPQQPLQGRGGE